MSVNIKVSYTKDEELQDILKRLEPITKKYKVAKAKKGQFYNAYVEVNCA